MSEASRLEAFLKAAASPTYSGGNFEKHAMLVAAKKVRRAVETGRDLGPSDWSELFPDERVRELARNMLTYVDVLNLDFDATVLERPRLGPERETAIQDFNATIVAQPSHEPEREAATQDFNATIVAQPSHEPEREAASATASRFRERPWHEPQRETSAPAWPVVEAPTREPQRATAVPAWPIVETPQREPRRETSGAAWQVVERPPREPQRATAVPAWPVVEPPRREPPRATTAPAWPVVEAPRLEAQSATSVGARPVLKRPRRAAGAKPAAAAAPEEIQRRWHALMTGVPDEGLAANDGGRVVTSLELGRMVLLVSQGKGRVSYALLPAAGGFRERFVATAREAGRLDGIDDLPGRPG